MTTPVHPFTPVPAPALVPARYGLYSNATVLDMDHGPWEFGIVWDDSDNCTQGGTWQPCCGRFDGDGTNAIRKVDVAVTFQAFPAQGGGVEFRAVAHDSWTGDPFAGTVTAGPTDSIAISTNGVTVVIGQEAACGATYEISAVFPGVTGGALKTGEIVVSAADAAEDPCTGTATLTFTFEVDMPTDQKVFDDSTFGFGDPFVIYDGRICPTLSEAQARASARNRLALSEQRQVEQMFWRGPNIPRLTDPTTVVLNANGAGVGQPVSPQTGIALLEACLSDRYLGVGLIHTPRWTAGLLAREYQISDTLSSTTQLKTPLGTPLVFGAGYPGTGPEGQPLPATTPVPGQAWMYATGQIVVRRSPIIDNATRDRTGCVTGLAERNVVLAVQCDVRCAVLVDFARCDCPEPTP